MSKKIEIKSVIRVFESVEELNTEDQELLDAAQKAALKAYAPYSSFYVGAALRLKNGIILSGNNQENMAYPSGLCAERVAVFAAGAQYPDVPVEAMAITARSPKFEVDSPATPCGACRQVLAEYESRHKNNIRLILKGQQGNIYLVENVKTLLPLMFNEEGLKKV